MCVMDELHQYVPTISTTLTVDVNDTEQAEVIIDDFHPILAGGDMLTTARARGSQRVRKCGHRPKDRLEGVLPVCEDWHCKVVLPGVSVHTHTLTQTHTHTHTHTQLKSGSFTVLYSIAICTHGPTLLTPPPSCGLILISFLKSWLLGNRVHNTYIYCIPLHITIL